MAGETHPTWVRNQGKIPSCGGATLLDVQQQEAQGNQGGGRGFNPNQGTKTKVPETAGIKTKVTKTKVPETKTTKVTETKTTKTATKGTPVLQATKVVAEGTKVKTLEGDCLISIQYMRWRLSMISIDVI